MNKGLTNSLILIFFGSIYILLGFVLLFHKVFEITIIYGMVGSIHLIIADGLLIEEGEKKKYEK